MSLSQKEKLINQIAMELLDEINRFDAEEDRFANVMTCVTLLLSNVNAPKVLIKRAVIVLEEML